MKKNSFEVAFFNSKKDVSWNQTTITNKNLAEVFLKVITSNNKDVKNFLPGTLKKGKTRADKNVKFISMLVFDFDKVLPNEFESVLKKLLPYRFLYYTTYSHTAEKVCARVILPLEVLLKPKQFREAWQKTSIFLGGLNDEKSNNISRIYYLPTRKTEDNPFDSYNNDVSRFFNPRQLPAITTSPTRNDEDNLSIHTSSIEEKIKRIKSQSLNKSKWESILKGDSIAQSGERHNTLVNLTWEISKYFTNIPPKDIARVFLPSLKSMRNEPDPPTEKEVIGLIESAQGKIQTYQKDARAQKIKRVRIDDIYEPYTDQELDNIADTQKCDISDLETRWILYNSKRYFFLGINGYSGPFVGNLKPLADIYLSPTNYRVQYVNKQGNTQFLTEDKILLKHGSPIANTIIDLTIDKSWYDTKSQTYYDATAKKKGLVPQYHEDIQGWFDIFTFPNLRDKFLDWIAVFPDLTKSLCALCIHGPTGLGKNLLTNGLTSIWHEGSPTDIEEALSTFNERITKSPLIFADEYVPQMYGRSVTGDLRKLIGASMINVQRKNRSTAKVKGYVRVVLASNEENLLTFNESIGREGLEALAKRLLYIPSTQKSVDYLKSISLERKEQWSTSAFGEHVLWLNQNRDVQAGDRFYVEGSLGSTIRNMSIGGHVTSIICEWIVNYLLGKRKLQHDQRIFIEGGQLYINNKAVLDKWDVFSHAKLPNSNAVAKGLRAISVSQESIRRRVNITGRGNVQVRYWVIDTENIVEWAEKHNFSSREEIEKNLVSEERLEKNVVSIEGGKL